VDVGGLSSVLARGRGLGGARHGHRGRARSTCHEIPVPAKVLGFVRSA
jgi:hypothetical protein